MLNTTYTSKLNFPSEICGGDVNSFAQYTLRERFPYIVEQVISDNNYETHIVKELKKLLSEVKDGTIKHFGNNQIKDALSWKQYTLDHLGKTWFQTPFFFVEMYFYRRTLETIKYFSNSGEYVTDPYKQRKQDNFFASISHVESIARLVNDNLDKPKLNTQCFQSLILASLWSNRVDLSLFANNLNLEALKASNSNFSNLLINDLPNILKYVSQSRGGRIDIILDNAGMELLADFGLTDYLLSSGLADKVFLHCKQYPIFVSDATKHDTGWTLETMLNNSSEAIQNWAKRLIKSIEQGNLIISDSSFWTLPLYFRNMPENMYQELSKSNLVISKGDANYRRLVDDRHWDFSTPFSEITNYFPTRCLALRTLKSEVLTGLPKGKLNDLQLEKDWLFSGKYGLIQFA